MSGEYRDLVDAILDADPADLLRALTRVPEVDGVAVDRAEVRVRRRAERAAEAAKGRAMRLRTDRARPGTSGRVVEGTIQDARVESVRLLGRTVVAVFEVVLLGPDGRTIWGPYLTRRLPSGAREEAC